MEAFDTAVSYVDEAGLRAMQRSTIDDRAKIAALLRTILSRGIKLRNGIDRRSALRVSTIKQLLPDRILLNASNIKDRNQQQLYFEFDLDHTRYFFAAPLVRSVGGTDLAVSIPHALYVAERRGFARVVPRSATDPRQVELLVGRDCVSSSVVDWSYDGLALLIEDSAREKIKAAFRIRYVDGYRAGETAFALLRSTILNARSGGMARLGVSVSQVPFSKPIRVQRTRTILDDSAPAVVWRRIALAGSVAKGAAGELGDALSPDRRRDSKNLVRIVEYQNGLGQTIRGIVNSTRPAEAGTAVVLPPAWGKTKETLFALADVIVSTFEKAGEPIVVLRYDGTNRAGESYVDPKNQAPGHECLSFKFSQEIDDLRASCEFLARSEFQPKKTILVTFSLSAIAGRRLVASQRLGLVDAWISVVGMTDLQSGLRAVSGGIDYAYGFSGGVKFGRHELVGVMADMDLTGADAMEHRLVFFEDARQDMARVSVPVTWIHGRHDAWMDLDRVRRLMSSGDRSGRKLVEVPSGHQMRNSREALENFQLIAREVGRHSLGRSLAPAIPNMSRLKRVEAAERRRRPSNAFNSREFWRNYLLGRDGRLGMELLTATGAYRELMQRQIEFLALRPGGRVLDLGAGVGSFALQMSSMVWTNRTLGDVSITQVDLVTEALKKNRARLRSDGSRVWPDALTADLEIRSGRFLPFRDSSADAVLLSLVVSYLREPSRLLEAVMRVLRPGGTIVVSSLAADADISKVYAEGVSELSLDRAHDLFGISGTKDFQEVQRSFLSDGAKLLALEEQGQFHFWEPEGLAQLVHDAGYRQLRLEKAFGAPPQAIVVRGQKPPY